MKIAILFIFIFVSSIKAYENLSPAQVYARLAAGDSLQLLDVREVSEYEAGHIAEPPGMPIVVPANMPWSSGVLNNHYDKLAKDIDIIVNCRSGGRSASASSFLESKGFTRIFNMTSGFNGWSYDSRKGGYGDGSGEWVGDEKVIVRCSQDPQTAWWNFFQGGVFPDAARYVELHKVSAENSPFENLPENSYLYYTIVLDQFGLPVYRHYLDLGMTPIEFQLKAENIFIRSSFFTPFGEWVGGDGEYWTGNIYIGTTAFIRWWLIETKVPDFITVTTPPESHSLVKLYPNPFNGQLNIDAPIGSQLSIYDVRGRFITSLENNTWQPESHIGSGLFFVQVVYQDKVDWKKVVYNK